MRESLVVWGQGLVQDAVEERQVSLGGPWAEGLGEKQCGGLQGG